MKLRHTFLFVISWTLSAFVFSASHAASIEWKVTDGGNGHFYEAVSVGSDITWEAAQAAAVARGPGWHLATITSAEENAFVESLFRDNSDFFNCCAFPQPLGRIASGPWLGGSSSTLVSNDWTWITGEVFGFSDWGFTAPASNGDHISFAEFGFSRDVAWNDVPSGQFLGPQSYIVESPVPEPQTYAMMLAGLGVLVVMWRRRQD